MNTKDGPWKIFFLENIILVSGLINRNNVTSDNSNLNPILKYVVKKVLKNTSIQVLKKGGAAINKLY